MLDHEALLFAYEADVQYPEVSGLEHLDMLLTRSQLAKVIQELTEEQRARMAQADQRLLSHAHEFYAAIAQIANLQSWRSQEHVPTNHWWWYLDVLAAAPVVPADVGELVAV